MSREQLEKFAHNLRNEIEREREERNFFQLERDKGNIDTSNRKKQFPSLIPVIVPLQFEHFGK